MKDEMEQAYTVKEVAKILDAPERTIRKRIEDGVLQSCQSKHNPKAHHLIPESFLAEFIVNNPHLPEVRKYKTEKARKIIAEMREPYPNEKK